jgi:hypothetical protein
MLSFLRKQESSLSKFFWTPAFAGVTVIWGFSATYQTISPSANLFSSAQQSWAVFNRYFL